MSDSSSLTPIEMALACHLGCARHTAALLNKSKERSGEPRDGWGAHIEGAGGEMAFGKWLGVYPGLTCNTYKDAPDVAGCEVRTRSSHSWELKLTKEDDDAGVYVLVTGKMPHYRIRGWAYARDGKKAEYWHDLPNGRGEAYWMPQNQLQPMSTLPNRVLSV